MSDYTHQPLEYDTYLHIYNRGINSSILFKNRSDNELFLKKYIEYIEPVAETFAWCLMGNHFHLLVRILPEDEILQIKPKEKDKRNFPLKKKYNPVRQFSHLFNSYAKSFNNKYSRTGGLFETSFRRILIEEDRYLKQLIYYIHYNPIKHGCANTMMEYEWSSYTSLVSEKPTHLKRDKVINWFGSRQEFVEFHKQKLSEDDFGQFDLDEVE